MPHVPDSKHILVVDDGPRIREILIQRLRTRGWTVEGAEDGDTAITKLAMADYDLLILDLMIGAVGGNDVFLALQRPPKKPRVIVLSALSDLWKRSHAYLDAFALFPTPVEFS